MKSSLKAGVESIGLSKKVCIASYIGFEDLCQVDVAGHGQGQTQVHSVGTNQSIDWLLQEKTRERTE